MPHAFEEQLAEAHRRVNREQELRGALPGLEEQLKAELYALSQLELAMESLTQELRSLESFSLAGLAASLLGGKEQKIAERQEQLAELNAEHEKCNAAIHALQQESSRLQGELTELSDARQFLDSLLSDRQSAYLDAGGEKAERLSRILDGIEDLHESHRRIDRAIEAGRHLLERLHSMTLATGRTRQRAMQSHQVGAIGALLVNSVTRYTAKGSVDRAQDGVQRFCDAVGQLSFDEQDPIDGEIVRLSAVVSELHSDLVGGSAYGEGAAGPLLDAAIELVGHLEEKRDRQAGPMSTLEADRRAVLESSA